MTLWIKRKHKNQTSIDEFDLLINQIAKARGIEELNDYMNPSMSKYSHNAYNLRNMEALAERIVKAIYKGQRITVVADIDGDGVCATAIMYNYLKELTDNIRYIHAQRSDGHGVETVLDQIEEEDEVILIVDSSSNSVEGCKILHEQGKDVLIIDHHIMEEENEYATIVNCTDGIYPNPHLSGSAMCYKVCTVLDDYLDIDNAYYYLDLATIGLVGDMMDMSVYENRAIANLGLDNIENEGVKEILKQFKFNYEEGITTTDISFKIAPTLSACSRFDKIELALECLTTDDYERREVLAKAMMDMNESRKSLQQKYTDMVVEKIESDPKALKDNVLIYVDNEITSGFRGLVATELVSRYNRPVFLVSETDDSYVGSARSIGIINTLELCQNSDLCTFATGHGQAHGLGFKKENKDKLIEYFNEKLNKEDLQDVVFYDLEISANDITEIDVREVESFARISGTNCPEPVVKLTELILEETNTKKLGDHVRAVLGKDRNTIKLNAYDFALMKFRTNQDYAKDVEEAFYNKEEFELEAVGTLNLNEFYNWGLREMVVSNQLFMIDYNIKKH